MAIRESIEGVIEDVAWYHYEITKSLGEDTITPQEAGDKIITLMGDWLETQKKPPIDMGDGVFFERRDYLNMFIDDLKRNLKEDL